MVVIDNSKGKAWKKTTKLYGMYLATISPRIYVGNLPKKTLEKMLLDTRTLVSRASDILVLVASRVGHHGWVGYHYGKPISQEKYQFFLGNDTTGDLFSSLVKTQLFREI